MGSSNPGSTGERSSWVRPLAVVVLVVVFGSSTLALVSRTAGSTVARGLGAVLFVGLAFVFWQQRTGVLAMGRAGDDGATSRETDASGDSSVWNAIPPWQYDGRHVESGGLTRGEQERALQEIQDEVESRADDPGPHPDE